VDRPKVFDHQGQEQDWDWLIATFGAVRMERVKVPVGVTKVYRIVKVQDMQGPGVQVVNVSDKEGNPLEGVRVTRYWPDAPELPAWPRPTSMWRRRGVYGETNANGDIGFGMGQGDYYYEPRIGASSVWVADETGPSDLISGLGMVGGTAHRHIDVYYQFQEVEPEPIEEPPLEPVTEPPVVPPEEPVEEPPVAPPEEPVVEPPAVAPEQPPGTVPEPPVAEPPLIVPEQPPVEEPVEPPGEMPPQPPDERWQMILDKLDLIITLLEERIE